MMKQKTSVLLLSMLIIVGQMTSFNANANDEDLEQLVKDTKSDMLMVIGGGLAGAILGLSTLSFVEEPKEHTKNITIGASFGIIAGVAVVALNQANKSKDIIYSEEASLYHKKEIKTFGTYARANWHNKEFSNRLNIVNSPYSFNFSLTY